MTTDATGKGVYQLRHAARLIHADPAALRRWMVGYQRGGKRYDALWTSDLGRPAQSAGTVSFRDLLELRLVAAFVGRGVSLRVIRATAEAARECFGGPYPLTEKRFLTDGRRIFLEAVDAVGEEAMLDVARRQFVFQSIIKPSLYAGIEYEGQGARRWFPLGADRRVIVLDPAVQFGAPVLTDCGVPTDIIKAAYVAEGEDRVAVARLFEIEPSQVDAAVRFEDKLAA